MVHKSQSYSIWWYFYMYFNDYVQLCTCRKLKFCSVLIWNENPQFKTKDLKGLWYIKVNLIDKEIGAQCTKQDLHPMFYMTSILWFNNVQSSWPGLPLFFWWLFSTDPVCWNFITSRCIWRFVRLASSEYFFFIMRITVVGDLVSKYSITISAGFFFMSPFWKTTNSEKLMTFLSRLIHGTP